MDRPKGLAVIVNKRGNIRTVLLTESHVYRWVDLNFIVLVLDCALSV